MTETIVPEIRPKPLRVITVRMEIDLHERIKEAAYQSRESMNQFCLRAIEEALQPKPQEVGT